MFKPLPLYIGLRYTRAKRRTHFISFISLVSILGIALGVMALITVLSVMNGFEKELRIRILGMASHAQVSALTGGLSDWPQLQKELQQDARIAGAAPQVEFEGMLNHGSQVSGAMIHGVLPREEEAVSDVHEKMVAGDMQALVGGEFGIVLGQELALTMGVDLGDKVTLITPQAQVTPAGILPRMRRFTVVGVFSVGMYEYDRATAFIHLDDGARLMRLKDEVSSVRLKLEDMFAAPELSYELNQSMGDQYWITDWTKQHANFFRAVKTEKRVMFFILLLIVAVAAFNIVSTLVMLVNDKRSDIAILRTLGLTPGQVMRVFMVQGILIGLIGTALGILSGVALAANVETIVPAIESFFNTKFLAPDVYYISDLPSDLRSADVLTVGLVAFFASMIMTLYPAWQASRTQPVEALRYE
jgi:lipoprotein-releasing system permease protein